MPIPRQHREDLARQLQVHRERLNTLQSQIEHMQVELEVQQVVLSLGNNEALLRVLDTVVDDPTEAARASENPRAYAAGRGLQIPEQLSVSIHRSGDNLQIRATYEHGSYPMQFQWASDSGFSARRAFPGIPLME
jgi:hypothetical protein